MAGCPASAAKRSTPSAGVRGETDGPRRGGQPRVERCQRRRLRRRRQRQMKRVGRAQWDVGQIQEEVLGAAMDRRRQLDTSVCAIVETPDDDMLHTPDNLSWDGTLTRSARQRRDNLGDRQLLHQQIVTSLDKRAELVAATLFHYQ